MNHTELLTKAVTRLAYARQVKAEYKAEIKKIEAELKADPLWKDLERKKELLAVAKADAADALEDVRGFALAAFDGNGNKRPHPAIVVKEFTTLNYELEDALEYCRQHLPQALILDRVAFEPVAKAVELDFVTVGKECKATVARDLSQYLEDDGEREVYPNH